MSGAPATVRWVRADRVTNTPGVCVFQQVWHSHWNAEIHQMSLCAEMRRCLLTFQSNEVTSLLLGTSWPPSRIQCLKTSWVELLLLFSLRFHIRAVESPDLMARTQPVMYEDVEGKPISVCYQINAQVWHDCFNHKAKKTTGSCPSHSQPEKQLETCVENRQGTNPDANRSLTGFQAQMKTSDSWPLRTMALFCGISTSPSTSIRSEWLSKMGTNVIRLIIKKTSSKINSDLYHHYWLANVWPPFSSPLAVFSPFLALLVTLPPVAEVGAAAAACWAILSR